MSVEGGMKCVKFLLFFFNFIFWLCGLALIILGIMVQVSLHHTLTIKDPAASAAPIIIITIGVVVFFVAFFGCCGAWKENYCMVTMFSILLSIIIIAEIGAAIAGYVFRGKVTTVVNDSLSEMLDEYKNSSKKIRDTVDELQKSLKCCGVNSSSDWDQFGPDGKTVPDSCCITVTTNCGKGAMTDAAKVYTQGCRAALDAVIKKNILWVIVAALVIAFLQLVGIGLACALMRGIRSGYTVM